MKKTDPSLDRLKKKISNSPKVRKVVLFVCADSRKFLPTRRLVNKHAKDFHRKLKEQNESK